MTRKPFIPVYDPAEEPADPSEQAARDFWDTHELTEAFLAKAEIRVDEAVPPAGPRDPGLLVRLAPETSRRLRALAQRRRTRPEALLEALLAEEECRGA